MTQVAAFCEFGLACAFGLLGLFITNAENWLKKGVGFSCDWRFNDHLASAKR